MVVKPIKTRIVEAFSCSLEEFLIEIFDTNPIAECSIIAITSKVVSLCEGNVVEKSSIEKDKLIEKEADMYLPKNSKNRYDVYLTIKNNLLIPSSGIDESNTGGYYVKLPENPQKTVNFCWEFLRKRYAVDKLGIIITDSAPLPLRCGVTGRCIAYCGFKAVDNRIGEKDLFGYNLTKTQINVSDAFAASAVLCMGETNEQMPVCIIDDVSFVEFKAQVPSEEELAVIRIDVKDDIFGQVLCSTKWESYKK